MPFSLKEDNWYNYTQTSSPQAIFHLRRVFFVSLQSASRTYSSAALFKIELALLGFGFIGSPPGGLETGKSILNSWLSSRFYKQRRAGLGITMRAARYSNFHGLPQKTDSLTTVCSDFIESSRQDLFEPLMAERALYR